MTRTLVSLKSPGSGFSSDLLGGKGFNLWKMEQDGVNVPPAFVIGTDVCREYMKDPEAVKAWLKDEALFTIHKGLSEEFGYMPLVSVRSGAKFSMPGMMDTILNVGLDDKNAAYWGTKLGLKCAEDCYSRLIEMYADVVDGIDRKLFDGASLSERLIKYKFAAKRAFPVANEQLYNSIIAVFESWHNERARVYRDMNGIPHDLGTAVVVQAMVFGNFNDKSATGVAFSRDPSTGANEVVGEFLISGQGEDVVAGIKTPLQLADMAKWNSGLSDALLKIMVKLEIMNSDMQEVEFTVQDGKLFILQTRNGKRVAQAAVKIAVDLVKEGMITAAEAMKRVSAKQILSAARPAIDPQWVAENPPHATGLGASNGVAVGKAVFSAEAAVGSVGPVIMITKETTPDDIAGMAAAVGILTQRGGSTSHAAVVARSMDKVAVVGCEAINFTGHGNAYFDAPGGSSMVITEGTMVAIDGASGNVWLGVEPKLVGGSTGAVRDFLAMLGDELGYYEVATKAEDIVNPKRVLVPAYAMELQNFEAEMVKMAAKVEDLIVDLREAQKEQISAPIDTMWGMPEATTIDKVLALINLKLKGVKVIMSTLSKNNMIEAGYSVIPMINSVDDLAMAEGLVVADHERLAAKKEEVAKAIDLKRMEGKPVCSLNCVSKLDVDAAKSGVKFAISPMNAAVSVLAE